MKFLCDNDVDVAVAKMLRRAKQDAWTAADAGLAAAADDDLTVYADESYAILLTHDKAFSKKRSRNVVGRHIFLRCDEWEAADLLSKHLKSVLRLFRVFDDLYVALSKDGIEVSHRWE